MTRRLVLAILGTTVAALLLAGLGTLGIATLRARATAERDLRAKVQQLAPVVVESATITAGRPALAKSIRELYTKLLDVDDVDLVRLSATGRPLDPLPAGVTAVELRGPAVLAGATVSSRRGRMVFAATLASVPNARLGATETRYAVVATRKITNDNRVLRFFLLIAVAVCLISAAVAVSLGRRLTKPLREADAAARLIAAGDLSTRLPEPPPTATDELSDLIRTINGMAEALERSKGLEQSFLLSVSHDLRTPLTSIRGYAEAITDGATSDPKWAAGVILSESRRLERLVRDLLDLAKLQANGFSFQPAGADLSALAVEALEGAAPDAAIAGVRLSAHSPAPVGVLVDRDRMAQVLANLVENAMKYALSSVQVGTQAAGGTAMVWVDDDGPGIAAADRPHVFERLYVTRREPRRREIGSGLGLAIVHELVTTMGGTVSAEEAPTGGARMVVRLPLATG